MRWATLAAIAVMLTACGTKTVPTATSSTTAPVPVAATYPPYPDPPTEPTTTTPTTVDRSWVPKVTAVLNSVAADENLVAAGANLDATTAEQQCTTVRGDVGRWHDIVDNNIPDVSIRVTYDQAIDAMDSSFAACADGKFDTAASESRTAQLLFNTAKTFMLSN